jgi:hypothetical protein
MCNLEPTAARNSSLVRVEGCDDGQFKPVARDLLGYFEEEGEGSLWYIVAGNETWVHHYYPENRRHLVEYRHQGSPTTKKFKSKASAGKVTFIVFYNSEGVVLTDFLVKRAAVNSVCYFETLKNLKNLSQGRGQKLMMCCFNKTVQDLMCMLPPLLLLHVWGLQCYHIQPTAQFSLQAISTCSPN